MSRKVNVISYVITMACLLVSIYLVINVCNQKYVDTKLVTAMLYLGVGAIIAGLVNTFIHELGHIVVGKRNGFVFSAVTVWFFQWKKVKKKIRFFFVMFGEEAGYSEMIPANVIDIAKSLKKMSLAGPFASLIVAILGIPALFITGLPLVVYALWSMLLPIGVYFFFSTLLPASTSGVLNDGAVAYGIKKKTPSLQVAVNVLKIQQEMYNGKTPSQIDDKLYFDVPQLAEDDLYFALLLNARYLYYLDKEDYENAKKISDRLLSISEYLPKEYVCQIKTDALYNACTFDYNEDVADDLVYELEKYLNNINTATNVRAKLAYLLYVKRKKENLDIFYKKGLKEAGRGQIKGLALFEERLFEKLKNDFK